MTRCLFMMLAVFLVSCGDVKTLSPVITLLGINPYTVAVGSIYMDAGVSVIDNVDIGLPATVTGVVDTAVVGTYVLTYHATDTDGNKATPVSRTIYVTDQTAPTVTLLGINPYTVAVGSTYMDAGVSVIDNVDVGLQATITGIVDTAVVGTNTLTYQVIDNAGNAATPVIRTVHVTDQTAPVITPPATLHRTILDMYGIASSDPYITAFLSSSTATDNVDLILTVTNDAPLLFPVGATLVTFTTSDVAGNTATATATVNISVQNRLFVGLTKPRIFLADYTAWEGLAGHRVHRIHYFYDFYTPPTLWTDIDAAMAAGYQVMLTMQATRWIAAQVTPLVDIYSGLMDTYIDANIQGILGLKATWPNADIWIRFGHEMNGNWYPWGSLNGHLGNTPQDYINAYRHIVDRFRKAGLGRNMVKWIFSPNVWVTDNFSQYYPGDNYVDGIGIAGFNFGSQTSSHPTLTWQNFNAIYQFTYDTLTRLYPNKAFFIAGVSSAELGGDKAAWIDNMSVQLSTGYPKVTGVFWFDENKKAIGEADWRINSSPATLAAIQRMYATLGLWKP